jgi:hypothetical protein
MPQTGTTEVGVNPYLGLFLDWTGEPPFAKVAPCRKRGEPGRTDHWRGVEAVGVDGGGFREPAQESPREVGHGGTVEAGNDDDGEVGCGAAAFGHFQERQRQIT